MATTTATPSKTPEQLAGEAATTAFTELLRVSNAAREDPPSRDWEPEIRRYAADPAAYAAVQSVRSYATLGLKQVGDSKVGLQVTSVNLNAPGGPTVVLMGCYDSRSSRVVHADSGEPVPPGTPPRYVWDVTVIRYESQPGQPWLVRTLQPRTDRTC